MSSSIFGGAQDTTDARNAQSGHSTNVAGPLSAGATDNAVALGGAAKLEIKNLAAASTDLAGNKGQLGGQTISNSGKGTVALNTNITSSDPQVAAQAIAAVADVSKQFGTQLKDYLTQAGTQTSQQNQAALGAISSLAGGQQRECQRHRDNKEEADRQLAERRQHQTRSHQS